MTPQLSARMIAIAAAMAAAALAQPRTAAAYTGFDAAAPARYCKYTRVTASVSATGVVSYQGWGGCNDASVVVKATYDPHSKRYVEVFSNFAKFEDTGSCPEDPWATRAPCSDQKISVQGDTSHIQSLLDPKLAPFSSTVDNATQIFQAARSSAAHPNAPVAPAALHATLRSSGLRQVVEVRWLAPDESGNRPFISFVLQARTRDAAGAAWITLRNVSRAGQDYDVTAPLPPTTKDYHAWVVRACSVTALAQTCTAPLSPDMKVVTNVRGTQKAIDSVPRKFVSSSPATVRKAPASLAWKQQPAPVVIKRVRSPVRPPQPNAPKPAKPLVPQSSFAPPHGR